MTRPCEVVFRQTDAQIKELGEHPALWRCTCPSELSRTSQTEEEVAFLPECRRGTSSERISFWRGTQKSGTGFSQESRASIEEWKHVYELGLIQSNLIVIYESETPPHRCDGAL
ncbi:hypothetical protein G5V57_21620 [Nordella sp. HKS 07]|uniref:hypothetical protein n=1 Tax=Nordella sp. HKS 07 TaxID=2712222 RepID=UPI0013E14E1A|nr:hypothetical protein [Nordella sp. HKS 07]QIG50090.1 hypothetical protein G5V57_21620 [Nordella sp. HKS 07]